MSAMQTQTRNGDRIVAAWLLACCALVFAMVVVGGVTRLTHSGLSIVEWQPIVGALPPLDEAAWQETFAENKQNPQDRLRHPRNEPRGLQGNFLVGVRPPAPRQADRRGIPAAAAVVRAAR